MMKRILLCALVVAGILALASTARAKEETLRDKYRVVQVDQFTVAKGVQFPAEYLVTLQQDIVKELRKSKSFGEVLEPGVSPLNVSSPVLRLGGTITHFNPGSRGKRYIGMGMGQAKIFALLTFSDLATGQTMVSQQIEGVLVGGFMGGNSKNVTREFGRTVARNAKVLLEKRLPAPGETPAKETAGPVQSSKAERQVIAMTSKDFEGSEKKLNENAAEGFRLVEFVVTGKSTAELTMEKIPVLARPPQYRIIHAHLIGTLEKNLNAAAAEGFCITPHTLGVFGSSTVVIVERTAPGESTLRQYRIHSTMRISSLQHHIQKDQAEGYRLAETWEFPAYGHLAIMERAAAKSSK